MSKLSLIDFLKRYTAISNKFIDEYFAFYQLCENNIFGIKLDSVIEYLDIKLQKKFYIRFRENYKVQQDYVIVRLNNKKRNEKKVIYYISFDTFEKICMASRTKKADQVRDYFVTLRKFIDYYKNNISDMILKKASKQPTKCIYIILANKKKNIFKFGQTKDLRSRLRSYMSGKNTHPDIKFIAIVSHPKSVEKCAKLFMKQFQHKPNQEIYKVDIDVIKKVAAKCAGIDKYVDEIDRNADSDAYVIYDDKSFDSIDYLDEQGHIIGYEKKIEKKKSTKKK